MLRHDRAQTDRYCLPVGLRDTVAAVVDSERLGDADSARRISEVAPGAMWEARATTAANPVPPPPSHACHRHRCVRASSRISEPSPPTPSSRPRPPPTTTPTHHPSAFASQGCIAAGRLSFFRSQAYLALARHVFGRPERWHHRWSEQTLFPLALAALAPGGAAALGDLELISAGCHGDKTGVVSNAVGRRLCEAGRTRSGVGHFAEAIESHLTNGWPRLPSHGADSGPHAVNFGVCAAELLSTVGTATSAVLAQAAISEPASRQPALANLRQLRSRVAELAREVDAAIALAEVLPTDATAGSAGQRQPDHGQLAGPPPRLKSEL